MLDPDEQPVAERLAVRVDRAARRVRATGERERPRRRTGTEHRDESPGMGADLLGGERGVPALTGHVRVGDQAAQVAVAGLVARQEQHGGVPGPASLGRSGDDRSSVRARCLSPQNPSWQRQRSGLAQRE
jgi:hypothetical protein